MYIRYEGGFRMYDCTKGSSSLNLVWNWILFFSNLILFFILKYSWTLELSKDRDCERVYSRRRSKVCKKHNCSHFQLLMDIRYRHKPRKSFLSRVLYWNVVCRKKSYVALYESFGRVHLILYWDVIRRINIVCRDILIVSIVFRKYGVTRNSIRSNLIFHSLYDSIVLGVTILGYTM